MENPPSTNDNSYPDDHETDFSTGTHNGETPDNFIDENDGPSPDDALPEDLEGDFPQELREQAKEILSSRDTEFLGSEDVEHAIGAIEEYDEALAKKLRDHVEMIVEEAA